MVEESRLYVFVDLQGRWMPAGLLVCQIENNRVLESRFRYGKRYLQNPKAFPIDLSSLPLEDREFATEAPQDIFLGIKDASPDSWGRAVMETRAGRVLREDEFLLASSGYRVGALAFSRSLEGPKREAPWSVSEDDESVIHLEDVLESYWDYAESKRGAGIEAAMRKYILPGSPMGGARPKAVVMYEGTLWLAKFQRVNDSFDFVRSEFACLQLAKQIGLNVPDIRIEKVSGKSVFLIKRFDRTASGDRLHLNSLFSVLKEKELSFMHSSYMEIADALKKYSVHFTSDQKEIFRRMVFNGLVKNTDDHLRNHALISTPDKKGFELSPLYDVVPDLGAGGDFRLAIGCGVDPKGHPTRLFSKDSVCRSAKHFGLEQSEAAAIFDQMHAQVQSTWRDVFLSAGFSQKELIPYHRVFGVSADSQLSST